MYIPYQVSLQATHAISIFNPLPLGANYNESDVVFVNQKTVNTLPFFFDRGPQCKMLHSGSNFWSVVTGVA